MKKIMVFFIFALIMAAGSRAEEKIKYFTLEAALDQALETNFQIRHAREEMKLQHGLYSETRGRLLPQIIGTGHYTKVEEDRRPIENGRPIGTDETWTVRVEGTQSLFIGGQDVMAALRDRLLKKAAVDELKAVINNIMLSVHEQFYLVLLREAQVFVREQAVQLLEKELMSAKQRLEAGTVSNFNVLRADVALANAQTPFIQARNDHRLALEDFRRVLGLSRNAGETGFNIDTQGELAYFEVHPELDESIEKALENRPELQQLEKEYKAGNRDVLSSRSEFLPDVKAFAAYQENTRPFSPNTWETIEGWEAGVRGEWEIFNGFSSLGRIRQAKSGRNISKIDLEEARLLVEIEVRRAYSTLVESRELVKASDKVVEQAEESLRLANARFDAGVATQLDVLDSQVALTNAGTNKVQALYQYNVAWVRFRRALGEFVQ